MHTSGSAPSEPVLVASVLSPLALVGLHANVRLSDISESLYIWEVDGQSLYFDNQETVRFRIEDEIWHDQIPVGPQQKDETAIPTSPYQLIATMEDAGLGPCLWWDGDPEAAEEEEG